MDKDWKLSDQANQCMKCGSVECAVCSEDLKIFKNTLTEDFIELDVSGRLKLKEIIKVLNRRFGSI